jgi:SOS-response transcriptional repressor LexA
MSAVAKRYSQLRHHPVERRSFDGTVEVMNLADRLRAAIDGKRKSHSWVAEEVGITPSALSAILTGKTGDPSFFTVLAIARAIEEPLSALVDDPLVFWSGLELDRLRETGMWIVERTSRAGAGPALEIPPRRKASKARPAVLPAAATPDAVFYADAFELERRRIPRRYAQLRADAVFQVRGESMTGEGIHPTDILYVRRTPVVAEAVGKIVVCSVDGMPLVKRLRTRARKLILESAHEGIDPLVIDEDAASFRLIGIVVGWSRT